MLATNGQRIKMNAQITIHQPCLVPRTVNHESR